MEMDENSDVEEVYLDVVTIEVVQKFCYLDENIGAQSGASVIARVRCGWVDLSKTPQAATTAGISEGGIVGVIIALLIIVLIVIDLGCYAKLNKGVTKFLLENVCKRRAAGKDKSTDVEAGASQETNLLAEKEKKDGEANGEENKEPASDEGVTDEKNEDKDGLMKDHTDEIEPDQKKDGDIIDQDPVKA